MTAREGVRNPKRIGTGRSQLAACIKRLPWICVYLVIEVLSKTERGIRLHPVGGNSRSLRQGLSGCCHVPGRTSGSPMTG